MKRYLRSISCMLIFTVGFIACSKDEPITTDENKTPAESGLYLGITGFNENLNQVKPTLFNESTLLGLQNKIDLLPVGKGSVLYHAFNTSVDDLQEMKLPDDLESVNIVTFTNNLDNGSYVLNSNYNSGQEYLLGLNTRITSEKLQNNSITAYTIGLNDNNINDVAAFNETLNKLSSGPNYVNKINSTEDFDSTFATVAQAIYKEITDEKMTLSFTAPEPGTKLRFTFDDVERAEASEVYIEGDFVNESNHYYLDGITYSNITSSSTSKVIGESKGITLFFEFNNVWQVLENQSITADYLQLWFYSDTENNWVLQNDFVAESSFSIKKEQKSSVVYLVLDCNNSLEDKLAELKQAVHVFIKQLIGVYTIPDPDPDHDTLDLNKTHIRFEKAGTANFVTKLAISKVEGNQWTELAQYNFAGSNGISDYNTIEAGSYFAEYYDTYAGSEGWFYCFNEEPRDFNFEAGKKYTLRCTETDQLVFDILFDGAVSTKLGKIESKVLRRVSVNRNQCITR